MSGGTLVEELAEIHGADAWRIAVVAGADPPAATRAALHALVIGAVDGGSAARRPAILALARSWALSSPGRGPAPAAGEPVADAFWTLPEALRSALWRADVLGLPDASSADAAAARGRVRGAACDGHRTATAGTACAATAGVLERVLADSAPGTKRVLVSRHVAGCDGCTRLLASVRDPAATVAATLPPAPALGEEARRAWREHVGAPRRTPAEQVREAATVVVGHRRPVAAVLALVAAGTFAAASGQLAASSAGPALAPLALPIASPAAPPVVVRRQVVIPPLAAEVASDPRFASLVTPDLAQVTPVAAPASRPPVAPPPAAPPPMAPAVPVGALPPAAEEAATVFDLPLSLPISFRFEVGATCSSIKLGLFSLPLLCES